MTFDLQSAVNACLTGQVVVPVGIWPIGNVVCHNPIDIVGTNAEGPSIIVSDLNQ